MLQVDLKHKKLIVVEEPLPGQRKKMEGIIDNLYKRIPLYLVMQKAPELHFSPLVTNQFLTRLQFETSREPIDTEDLDYQYVEKIRSIILKGKQKLFKEKHIW